MLRLKKKIEKLQFVMYCLGKSKDSRFMKRVMVLENEQNLVELKRNGEQSDNIYYFIDMKEINTGFFAVYNKLLAFLYFADYYGLKPVIRFDNSFPYAENTLVNGTNNPYEYYFKQPLDIMPENLDDKKCVLVCRKENSYLINQLSESANGYSKSELCIDALARISGKYIQFNEQVEMQLQKDCIIPEKKKVLGVHVRGTDFKRNYNGHPIQVEIDDYLSEALKVFGKRNYDNIFLATDDLSAIQRFKEEFGNKLLIYEDAVRSDGDDSVMNSQNIRENHHYLLGYEVLRDMYSLALCDGLVAGLSQVSYAARIQKKSAGKEYLDISILNKGINYHQKNNCPS